MLNLIVSFLLLIVTFPLKGEEKGAQGPVFVTTADTEHYPLLLNLIESIYFFHFTDLEQIAIFDIGFTSEERETLSRMYRVQVYDLELINKLATTKFEVTGEGKKRFVRGLYSWRPIAIKKALDMFPYIYYLDAGITLQASLAPLFDYIREKGSLLVSNGQPIYEICSQRGVSLFSLDREDREWIFDELGIFAGLQGLSRAMAGSYINPIYTLAGNINNFKNDDVPQAGVGSGGYDHLLFSIQARLLGLNVFLIGKPYRITLNNQPFRLKITDYFSFKPIERTIVN